MKQKFYAQVCSGKLDIIDRDAMKRTIEKLDGKNVFVIIGTAEKQRSNNENKYYWGVIVKKLCEELGYFPDEMHEILKHKFLINVKHHKIKDKIIMIEEIGSTAPLTVHEFEELMTRIRMWASQELNIFLPLPNEVDIDF